MMILLPRPPQSAKRKGRAKLHHRRLAKQAAKRPRPFLILEKKDIHFEQYGDI